MKRRSINTKYTTRIRFIKDARRPPVYHSCNQEYQMQTQLFNELGGRYGVLGREYREKLEVV